MLSAAQLFPYDHAYHLHIIIIITSSYHQSYAVLQAFISHLLTVDLPKLMVLPKRLEINIPPAVTAVAEAAVGRDVVMRAVASAVLQADALENALIAALPLGPQSAAGGVSLPDSFQGELQVWVVCLSNCASVSTVSATCPGFCPALGDPKAGLTRCHFQSLSRANCRYGFLPSVRAVVCLSVPCL